MKQKPVVISLLLALFTFFAATKVSSQQNKLDSVIFLLKKSRIKTGVDTATFYAACGHIAETTLDDTAISLIEKTATDLDKGDDEYFSYSARYYIMSALLYANPYKAISYGTALVEQLEQSKRSYVGIMKVNFLHELRFPFRNTDKLDEGFRYYSNKLKKYKLENDSAGMATVYFVLAGFYNVNGLLEQAIYNLKKSLTYMDTIHTSMYGIFTDLRGIDIWENNTAVIGSDYSNLGNYKEALRYLWMSVSKHSDSDHIAFIYLSVASIKLMTDQLDSVPYYLNKGEKYNRNDISVAAYHLQLQAFYNIRIGKFDEAETVLVQCAHLIKSSNIPVFSGSGVTDPDYYFAMIRIQQNRYNEAIAFLKADIIRLGKLRLEILRDDKLLAQLYEKTGEIAGANAANKSYIVLQDSLIADQAKYGNISFETEQEMATKELAITKLESDNKLSALSRNFSIGITALLLILTGLVYSRFRSKQKDNKALQKVLGDLRSTQQQLIQSEKMASLGELTAGIAHEIQNPLNFVNNFSEVNRELIEELKIKNEKLIIEDEEVKELLDDIESNLEKINHHGKRADAIVKGMLQHSRVSTGKKELTDINALCDEYLRLAYHGMRAKDKSFNATLETNFDNTTGKINAVPEDIGRVLLNLFNNAFYAVSEKKKSPYPLKGDKEFEPTVSVITERINSPSGDGGIEIRVTDNGTGIPQKVLDKIFQPFFTTKPTGQGTGLGLSLSYDIIKTHGGEIKVETKEGEGSEFVIQLPVT